MNEMRESFRKIETKLFKATIRRVHGSAHIVLDTVIHFTLGYQRLESAISYSTFQDMTGFARSTVRSSLEHLRDRNIIYVVSDPTNRKARTYALNTGYETWLK